MSDLRERLIAAAGHALERGVCDLNERTGDWWGPGQECGRRVGTTAVDAILPIIKAELQKILEQTVEVLEGFDWTWLKHEPEWAEGFEWLKERMDPLLDNLKARKP